MKTRMCKVALLFLVISLLWLPVMVQAQSYRFGVPELKMQVYVQPDGSTRIVYDITFENYGHAIDVVDIGLPHDDYDIQTMSASVDGQPLTDIRKSSYIDTGVEVHLDTYAIPINQQGTLHFECVMPDMVYADTTNKEKASLQITPTWFDASAVRGNSNIEIRVILPEGVLADEVFYQNMPFSDKFEENGRVVALWEYVNARATEAHQVGVSFPKRSTTVVEITFWDLLGKWLVGAIAVVLGFLTTCVPVIMPFAIMGGTVWFFVQMAKPPKPNYLPPIAQVEGGGIKRGLTAPEAAVVLELPLNKVFTFVIFGMLEKGLIRQTDDNPMTVEVVEEFRGNTAEQDDVVAQRKLRREAAQQKGVVIHKYEDPFLDLIEANPDKPLNKLEVVQPMEALVKDTAEKLQGFDLSDTQDYYRRVVARAMEQAAAIGELEMREQYLDKHLPWVMLDKEYRSVLMVGNHHYWPRWARTIHAGGGVAKGVSAASAAPKAPAVSTAKSRISPTFGDVSASFAGWAETTMGGIAGAIMPSSLKKPAPVSRSSSGYRSSGGSYHRSCACACAGCACACACAGGGR